MTDDSDNTLASQAFLSADERTAEIDRIVGSRLATTPVHVRQPSPPLKLSTADGVVRDQFGDPVREIDDGEVPDAGQDIKAEVAQLQARIDDFAGRLAEVTYDPVTGAASYKVQGADRDALRLQYEQFKTSALYQLDRLNRLEVQREQRERARIDQLTEAAAINVAAGGDPARAKAIREAIEAEETKQLAAVLVAQRKR